MKQVHRRGASQAASWEKHCTDCSDDSSGSKLSNHDSDEQSNSVSSVRPPSDSDETDDDVCEQ